MRRIIFLALTAIAFTGLTSLKLPPATVIDSHFERDVAFTTSNPCTGDLLTVTGHEILDLNGVINNNRANTTSRVQGRYEAVDQDGNIYSARSNFTTNQHAPLNNGAYINSSVYQLHFVGQGSVPNFKIRAHNIYVITPNGEVTVNKAFETSRCN